MHRDSYTFTIMTVYHFGIEGCKKSGAGRSLSQPSSLLQISWQDMTSSMDHIS